MKGIPTIRHGVGCVRWLCKEFTKKEVNSFIVILYLIKEHEASIFWSLKKNSILYKNTEILSWEETQNGVVLNVLHVEQE